MTGIRGPLSNLRIWELFEKRQNVARGPEKQSAGCGSKPMLRNLQLQMLGGGFLFSFSRQIRQDALAGLW